MLDPYKDRFGRRLCLGAVQEGDGLPEKLIPGVPIDGAGSAITVDDRSGIAADTSLDQQGRVG